MNYRIAPQVVATIKAGRIPAEPNWKQYLHWPWIDSLRQEIAASSFSSVAKLVKSPDLDSRILGVAISRHLQFEAECSQEIRRLLQHTWECYADYETRWWTMFRLFEYTDLAFHTHREAFDFVTGVYWEKWLEDCVTHFGGPHRILSVLKGRAGVASVAPSKTWSRILQTAGSIDQERSLNLAKSIAQDRNSDPLVCEALEFLGRQPPRETTRLPEG